MFGLTINWRSRQYHVEITIQRPVTMDILLKFLTVQQARYGICFHKTDVFLQKLI